MTEHLDVLIVGAGLSGIGAAHHLQTDCPWASYAIFEARDAIGGTWDLFRYPGIRSDSDMYTLGLLVPAVERREVDRRRRRRSCSTSRTPPPRPGIDQHIRFHHRIVAADWSTADARWTVTAERTDTERARRAHLRLPVLLQRLLPLRPRLPAGLRRAWTASTGTVIHPQAWPEDLDYAGKKVVVIGSGATAITLIPSLAEHGGARHHAPAVADATSRRCRRRTPWPKLLQQGPARPSRPARPSAG